MTDSLLRRPVLVDVNTQNGPLVVDRKHVSHDAQAANVGVNVQPNLELPGVNPHIGVLLVERGKLNISERHIEAGCVGLHPAFRCAQRLPERLLVDASLQIPERSIKRCDRIGCTAFNAAFKCNVHHLLVQVTHAAMIFTFDQWEELSDSSATAQCDALDALIGLKPQDGSAYKVVAAG